MHVAHRTLNPQQTADRVREAMFANDRAEMRWACRCSNRTRPRRRVTMTVREAMLNGHDICHGGLIFTLADSTFAFACNAYNEVTVAAGCSIDLIAPAAWATCSRSWREVSKAGRTGIYDMEVTNQRGEGMACSAAARTDQGQAGSRPIRRQRCL